MEDDVEGSGRKEVEVVVGKVVEDDVWNGWVGGVASGRFGEGGSFKCGELRGG